MKKLLLGLCIVTALLTGCGVLDVEVEQDRTYFLDNIKIAYENGDEHEWKYVFADKMDLIASSADYYKNDEKVGSEYYEADENGNFTTIRQDWDGGVKKTYEYVYDTEKRITEKKEFIDGVFQSRTEIVYGENGKEEKVTVYDENDAIISYQEFIYDGASKRTVNEYNADGELLRYMKHTYSYADVVAKEECYTSNDKLVSTTVWHYVQHTDTDYYIDVDTEALDKLR